MFSINSEIQCALAELDLKALVGNDSFGVFIERSRMLCGMRSNVVDVREKNLPWHVFLKTMLDNIDYDEQTIADFALMFYFVLGDMQEFDQFQ